jgi:2-hydroxyacylsphingosine 1-beta-galactosyltransferase
MNSIVEATTSGVPIIGLPLFAGIFFGLKLSVFLDQYRNTLMVQRKGVGIRLDKHTLTKEILKDAFLKIIDDPSFKKKANELARMIAKKPISVDERIVKYAEFAAEFDVDEALDISGRNLSTIEFYNIDVLCSMFLIILTALFVIYKMVVFRKLFKIKRD